MCVVLRDCTVGLMILRFNCQLDINSMLMPLVLCIFLLSTFCVCITVCFYDFGRKTLWTSGIGIFIVSLRSVLLASTPGVIKVVLNLSLNRFFIRLLLWTQPKATTTTTSWLRQSLSSDMRLHLCAHTSTHIFIGRQVLKKWANNLGLLAADDGHRLTLT